MKSTDTIQRQINELTAKLSWLNKYAPNTEIFSAGVEIPNFMVFCYADDRDAKLTEVGQLLGTDGWTATQDRSFSNKVNWHKEIDGMTVKIFDAQGAPDQPSSWPVPPTAFPLQLADTTLVV